MGTASIGNIPRSRATVVIMDLSSNTFFGGTAPEDSSLRGVCALVLVGGRADSERFGEFPFALLDVLGRSPLMRMLDRIRSAGVEEIAVISDTDLVSGHAHSAESRLSVVSADDFWSEALQSFCSLSQQSECVLVLRLGAWAEIDLAALANYQRNSGNAVVQAISERGEDLDIFAISSTDQARAASLFRSEMRDRRFIAAHPCSGYVNLLTTPDDLRRLTLDAFAGECSIRPCGRELRPGVWVGEGVRLHRSARVVAPAFIGSHCSVRRAAVITRCSSVEHHSEIDCATVIDNSTVLPYTRVGAGLEVEYSVVGFRRLHSGAYMTTARIDDPHLIDATNVRASLQLVAFLNWLFILLPSSIWRTFVERRAESALNPVSVAVAPHALKLKDASPRLALKDAAFAASESQDPGTEVTITRRYGNEQ